MKASDFAPPPHRTFPPWVRVASLIPLYGISWPLIKTLELCGIWPKLMSRRPMAPPAPFGDYRPAAHDVIVSSYFKAGTTWTLQIATQIAFRGQAELLTLDQQRRIDEHCRDHLQRLGCEFPYDAMFGRPEAPATTERLTAT